MWTKRTMDESVQEDSCDSWIIDGFQLSIILSRHENLDWLLAWLSVQYETKYREYFSIYTRIWAE